MLVGDVVIVVVVPSLWCNSEAVFLSLLSHTCSPCVRLRCLSRDYARGFVLNRCHSGKKAKWLKRSIANISDRSWQFSLFRFVPIKNVWRISEVKTNQRKLLCGITEHPSLVSASNPPRVRLKSRRFVVSYSKSTARRFLCHSPSQLRTAAPTRTLSALAGWWTRVLCTALSTGSSCV